MGLFVNIFLSVAIFLAGLLIYVVHVFQERAKYFKKIGVPYMGAGLGKLYRQLSGNINFIHLEEEVYHEAIAEKSAMVAQMDITGSSSFYITDLDLVKKICVRDFDHFVNLRPMNTHKSSKYFTKMMFVMENELWKSTRAKMTPAFTTGKIKRMFQIFKNSSERMDTYIKEQMQYPRNHSMNVDFFKVLFKYSMDVIANCAFGIESKSWELPMEKFSEFERNGKLFEFNFDAKNMIKFIVMVAVPKLADLLGFDILDTGAQKYFADIVQGVLKHRRSTGERREDFLQLMMDIQQGTLKAEDGEDDTDKLDQTDKFVFDDEYLIANALMFFLGGFDTTQTVLLFSVYSLALNQQAQEKLYREVKRVVEKYDGELSYEAVSEMPYLDMVINETMRLYPATPRVERACTQDYLVEELGFTMKKGTFVSIPIHGIHMDPTYYPNPKMFDPERFAPENKASRHQYSFLPFGHGPRSCPGLRFALIKVKMVIAQTVHSYKLEPCSKTVIPVKFDDKASAKPLGGMWLNATVRQ